MKRRHFCKALTLGGLLVQPRFTSAGLLFEDEDELPVKDYIHRMRHPDGHYQGDIFTADQEFGTLRNLQRRLAKVRRTVGYGNFNILGFDDMLLFARRYPGIGRFEYQEIDLLDLGFVDIRYPLDNPLGVRFEPWHIKVKS